MSVTDHFKNVFLLVEPGSSALPAAAGTQAVSGLQQTRRCVRIGFK